MASSQTSTSRVTKKPKITIKPPRQLFIDLTKDDVKTQSPKHKPLSQHAPNAPIKTPSTRGTLSSSLIAFKLNLSSFYSSSPSTNPYLSSNNSSPPRVSHPSTHGHYSYTFTNHSTYAFNTPSPPLPSPPIVAHPITFNLLDAYEETWRGSRDEHEGVGESTFTNSFSSSSATTCASTTRLGFFELGLTLLKPVDKVPSKSGAQSSRNGQAIASMIRSQEADPTNLEVFLALRVSHTNVNENNARFHQGDDSGDHIALLEKESNFSTQWCFSNEIKVRSMEHARDIRKQLEVLLKRIEIDLTLSNGDLVAIKKAIISGYFPNLAKIHENGSYLSVKHRESVCIHSSSGLAKVIYHEIVSTAKEYMRQVRSVVLP
ncbi:pre-mRNA-splicing factor ATP-dependent RNA helicase DEAH1-like protein [Tanacetum coccineum]